MKESSADSGIEVMLTNVFLGAKGSEDGLVSDLCYFSSVMLRVSV